VLVSTDGGQNFSPVGGSIEESVKGLVRPPGQQAGPDSGNQGDYNNCLAVAPNNAAVVAIGWRRGPWISTQGGKGWIEHGDADSGSGRSPHLHGDLHAVHFDENDASGQTLFVGSDGGVAGTTNLGSDWRSDYNRYLTTLEVHSYDGASQCVAASPRASGLVAVATQDNANLFGTGPWQGVFDGGGDGVMVCFLDNGALLVTDNNKPEINARTWTAGSALAPVATIPTYPGGRGPVGGAQPGPGLATPLVAPVLSPSAQNQWGQTIWAVAALDTTVDRVTARAGGKDLGWESVISLPTEISALASANGRTALVATTFKFPRRIARFFEVDCAAGTFTELTGPSVPLSNSYVGAPVTRMVMLDSTNAYCNYKSPTGSFLLRFDRPSKSWVTLQTAPPGSLECLDADSTTNPPSLFVATSERVFVSRDLGASWWDVTRGLPGGAQITDIKFVNTQEIVATGPRPPRDRPLFPRAGKVLYVGTRGRSLWRSST